MRLHFSDLSNPESISQAFGFPVPLPFAQFLMELYKLCNHDNQKCSDLFERLTGQMLDGMNASYQQTPPELFPIASMGVDGVHFGYVIHAPEIYADDFPIGEICPMDSDGVILFGNTTQEALENLAGYVVDGENDRQQLQEILNLYELFGLRPNKEPKKTRFSESGNGLPVIPKIPSNWLHLPTSDGIGVLAPREKFRNDPFASIENLYEPIEYIKNADRALLDNFPATALYYLREGFWNNWTNDVDAQSFSSRMIKAYLKLNRPILAEKVEWKVKRYFKGKIVR